MKYYLVLIYGLLIWCNSFAQKEDMELYQEVVIVLFDDYKNNITKRKASSRYKNKEKQNCRYYFYFNNRDNVQLSFREFDDFDEMEKDNPELFFKVNKSFLKKNKDIILTKEKILKLGYKKTFDLLYYAKHILLIDKSEIKDGKIIIKKVHHSFIGEM